MSIRGREKYRMIVGKVSPYKIMSERPFEPSVLNVTVSVLAGMGRGLEGGTVREEKEVYFTYLHW